MRLRFNSESPMAIIAMLVLLLVFSALVMVLIGTVDEPQERHDFLKYAVNCALIMSAYFLGRSTARHDGESD